MQRKSVDWFVKWVNVLKNGPSKICRRQPLKDFTWSILEYLDPNVTLALYEFKFYFEVLTSIYVIEIFVDEIMDVIAFLL